MASFKQPASALAILKAIAWQKKAVKVRHSQKINGLHVPPFMIASITESCNLQCKGCYARAHNRKNSEELNREQLTAVFKQAEELGISLIMLAGGEPFTRKDLLEITAEFKKQIFPVFTNGMLIDDQIIRRLRKQKHVVPVLSIEGFQEGTDNRRGEGVYDNTLEILSKLNSAGIFSGISLTMTRKNYKVITGDSFIKKLIKTGSKLYFYVEYIPVKEGTEELIPTSSQRLDLDRRLAELRKDHNGLFIAFPGDEKMFGGCLSAGRGFIHVSADGSLEPCPFAPYSDSNLKKTNLADALSSQFLAAVRANHAQLSEEEGGCALWNNREWLKALLPE